MLCTLQMLLLWPDSRALLRAGPWSLVLHIVNAGFRLCQLQPLQCGKPTSEPCRAVPQLSTSPLLLPRQVLVEVLQGLQLADDSAPYGGFVVKLNHRRILDAMLAIAGVPPHKFRHGLLPATVSLMTLPLHCCKLDAVLVCAFPLLHDVQA